MNSKIKTYIIGILIPLAVGGLSALLTSGSMDIYQSINNPPLAPPPIVFPIVWTILFTLMCISSAIIYNTESAPLPQRKSALYTYALSLVFNFFWSIIFFGGRAYLFAFIWLIILWFLIFRTIKKYSSINPLAAILQIPYLLWVTFAGYLNLAIWILNK